MGFLLEPYLHTVFLHFSTSPSHCAHIFKETIFSVPGLKLCRGGFKSTKVIQKLGPKQLVKFVGYN